MGLWCWHDVPALLARSVFFVLKKRLIRPSRLDRPDSLVDTNIRGFQLVPIKAYFSITAKISSSRWIRNSSPSIFTSVPEYLPKRTTSPNCTSPGIWSPPSERRCTLRLSMQRGYASNCAESVVPFASMASVKLPSIIGCFRKLVVDDLENSDYHRGCS